VILEDDVEVGATPHTPRCPLQAELAHRATERMRELVAGAWRSSRTGAIDLGGCSL
jgi:hypothetical protein